MNMPFTLNTAIITGNDERREEGNRFTLELEGYHLFVLECLLNIQRTEHAMPTGKAKIIEVTWREGKTLLIYELVDLHNVN